MELRKFSFLVPLVGFIIAGVPAALAQQDAPTSRGRVPGPRRAVIQSGYVSDCGYVLPRRRFGRRHQPYIRGNVRIWPRPWQRGTPPPWPSKADSIFDIWNCNCRPTWIRTSKARPLPLSPKTAQSLRQPRWKRPVYRPDSNSGAASSTATSATSMPSIRTSGTSPISR